jgi:hexokinase
MIQNLLIQVSAIINDGSATLLSRAYATQTTRFGLILGTGTNVSVMLPVSAIPAAKLAGRPESWMQQAREVLVNTEYSMFGQDVLPFTKWDEELNSCHRLPDFQPFEHFVGGRYIGELVRRVVMDAITQAELFGGQVPDGLDEEYELQTKTLGIVEA